MSRSWRKSCHQNFNQGSSSQLLRDHGVPPSKADQNWWPVNCGLRMFHRRCHRSKIKTLSITVEVSRLLPHFLSHLRSVKKSSQLFIQNVSNVAQGQQLFQTRAVTPCIRSQSLLGLFTKHLVQVSVHAAVFGKSMPHFHGNICEANRSWLRQLC